MSSRKGWRRRQRADRLDVRQSGLDIRLTAFASSEFEIEVKIEEEPEVFKMKARWMVVQGDVFAWSISGYRIPGFMLLWHKEKRLYGWSINSLSVNPERFKFSRLHDVIVAMMSA